MRVAFVGKGGSGKSTTVGTLARILAADGERTLVLDSDVMPGLAGAMGIEFTDAPIHADAVVEGEEEGPKFRLRDGLSAEDAVEQYALRGPDGVMLLQIGKIRTEGAWAFSSSIHAFNQIKEELPEEGWNLIGDLPGGTRQPFFGWGSFAPLMIAVVEPTVKSFVTARRLRRHAEKPDGPRLVAVANKVTGADDVSLIRDETGLDVIGEVPDHPSVRDADRDGVAVFDVDPGGPVVSAIRSLSVTLREETA